MKLDLKCWLEPAMIYVSLSRVQRLEQLYILGELPESKIKPWQDSKEEMNRLNEKDLSKREKLNFKLSSMNIYSLQAHFEDLLQDEDMVSSEVICLQESWLKPDQNSDSFSLAGKQQSINSVRSGAGIVTYYSQDFKQMHSIISTNYQITSISSKDTTVINMYRSSDANDQLLLGHLNDILETENEKDVYICTDLNLCHIENRNHVLIQFLLDNSFSITRDPLTGTHKKGRCLDMIWHRGSITVESSIKFVYYSDHAQNYVKIRRKDEQT